jgi:DNA-binding MarR family transcriptional regulator
MDSALRGPAGGRAPSIGYLVWHLTLRWRGELDRALAPQGLTGASYAVLASLYSLSSTGTQPSQRELADFSGLETMYVSKLVRALARAGLLEREEDPADSRALRVRITERGIDAVNAGRAVVLALEDQRLAPLGGRQSQASVALHDALLALLRHADATVSAPAEPEPRAGRRRVREKESR